MPEIFHGLLLILTIILCERYYLHFAGEETEAERLSNLSKSPQHGWQVRSQVYCDPTLSLTWVLSPKIPTNIF